ncbi:Asp23/Gls24 family envelope stress response protein [Lacticaseibacillus sp. 866-1]|uniref:Asp23/Gls24 family envelope stress response protein n=1 Tax=Lacticaseibacillus sp. 866-1 TaxID=2799576 RepID=UPI00194383BC|nr:Asp23/Gls24 family envelope stress response protein [Lacticaseibacillus sp. 866-1]
MQTTPAPASTTAATSSKLTFEPYVLEKIAGICAQQIPGILAMDGNVVDKMAESLGRDEKITKGIKAEVGEHQVAVDMTALLEFDADAKAVHEALITAVQAAALRMTGLQLVELNLHVADVLTRSEWQKHQA